MLTRRILEVRRLCVKARRKRRALMAKLDDLGDTNYKNVPIVLPPQELTTHPVNLPRDPESAAAQSGGVAPQPKRRGRKRKDGKPVGPVGRPKKKREPGEPECPERPRNPFYHFVQENREKVGREYLRENGVELRKKEVAKLLEGQWEKMTNEEKQVC